jgi:hypothetical protein
MGEDDRGVEAENRITPERAAFSGAFGGLSHQLSARRPVFLPSDTGFTFHFVKIGPVVDHAAIGQPADPVHAAGSFTHLALAAALDAKHRGRIGKRPSWRRGKGQPQRK